MPYQDAGGALMASTWKRNVFIIIASIASTSRPLFIVFSSSSTTLPRSP